MEPLFEKYTIQKDRVSDRITAVLKQAFLDGTLKPGDKLPTEEKIASQFQVSKVAVREALRDLEAQGLVRKARGMYGGNFISAPDVKLVGDSMVSCFRFGTLTEEEMIDFRQSLEPVLIQKAVRLRTQKDLEAMKANIQACEQDLAQGKTQAKKHIEFHILIARACRNSLFVAVMEAMAEIFESIAAPWQDNRERMRQDIDYNHKFYQCILDRDEKEAEKLMIAHFDLTRQFRQEDLDRESIQKK
ncbi:FadR/GntR family transcriptional regulator [Desulfospira joergensenii]|uniref:FadR/GntR family transcriptional regulator n=1 Tax=Desulfospira joergensenii TaxID=53329 RepID=UPI0003B7AF38|nr:FCD domain-containing protein [Desulfospira joergensenii]